MSATARKRKEEVAQALKKLIQSKGKTPAMKYQQLFDDLRSQSEAVSPFISFLIRTSASLIRRRILTMITNLSVAPGHHQGHVRRGAPSSHGRGLLNGHREDCAPAVNTCTLDDELLSSSCL